MLFRSNGRKVAIQPNAKLSGDELRMTFVADWGEGPVRHEFMGRVGAGQLHGVATLAGARGQGRYEWTAEPVEKGK